MPEPQTKPIATIPRRIDAAIRFAVPISRQQHLRALINELISEHNDFRSRAVKLCLQKASEFQIARDEAYKGSPTCDAVGENEIRKAVAELLANELEQLK